MGQFYMVHVNDAPKSEYKTGHFPRKFLQRRNAVKEAKEAVAFGASFARVECPNGGELDFRPDKPVLEKHPKRKVKTDPKRKAEEKIAKAEKKAKKEEILDIGVRVRDNRDYAAGTITEVDFKNQFPYRVLFDNGREATFQAISLHIVPESELAWENLNPKLQDAIDEYAEAVSDRVMDSEYGTSNAKTMKLDKAVQQKKLKLAKLIMSLTHNG